MKSKLCKSCNAEKKLSEFNSDITKKDGLDFKCKICNQSDRRSVNGLIQEITRAQKCSSKRRGHNPPEYTNAELKTWILNQCNFATLYLAWVASGYKQHLNPSIDRLDNSKGYSFDNIRLVTWGENLHKETIKLSKLVSQKSLSGKLIKTFDSMVDANKETGIARNSIYLACNGIYKRAGNFTWEFV